MPKRTPYDILGIGSDATLEQAKRSFRLLARQYHPDRNPGDKTAEARFKEAEDAWTELEQILPRSVVPLEIPAGATEQEIEDAYVKWLLHPTNAPSKKPARNAAPAAQGEKVWSTVAAEPAGTALVRGDWRKLQISRARKRVGLEGISAEQAARLLDSHPNAFLVLKIVQQHFPELCLYDAILARAQHARSSPGDSTALVIVGAEAVNEPACARAVQDPLAAMETAEQNLHLIAPRVRFGGAAIPAKKLAMDLWFLEENIRELAATLNASL